eukprot:1159942-Pelagomonas_calceolata.AAC.7
MNGRAPCMAHAQLCMQETGPLLQQEGPVVVPALQYPCVSKDWICQFFSIICDASPRFLHRSCNTENNSDFLIPNAGPLLSEAQVKSANFTAYPVWLATSSTQFLQALNEIMEHSFEGTDNRRHRKLQVWDKEDTPFAALCLGNAPHLEMVFILNDISLASGKNGLWGPGLIPHDALLHGGVSLGSKHFMSLQALAKIHEGAHGASEYKQFRVRLQAFVLKQF